MKLRTTTALIFALAALQSTVVAGCDVDPDQYTETETLDASPDAPDGTNEPAYYVSRAGPTAGTAPAPRTIARPVALRATVLPLEPTPRLHNELAPQIAAAVAHVGVIGTDAIIAVRTALGSASVIEQTMTPLANFLAEALPEPELDEKEEDEEADEVPTGDATEVFFGPKGKRFAAVHVEMSGGGSGWSDVSAKVLRLRGGKVERSRQLSFADEYEDLETEEEEEALDASAAKRTARFHAKLVAQGYTRGRSIAIETYWEDDDTPEVHEGLLEGTRIEAEEVDRKHVRVRITPPGSERSYVLGRARLAMEECGTWDPMGETTIRRGKLYCEPLTERVAGAWLSPDGRYLVVEVTATGSSCRSDTTSTLVVGRLR